MTSPDKIELLRKQIGLFLDAGKSGKAFCYSNTEPHQKQWYPQTSWLIHMHWAANHLTEQGKFTKNQIEYFNQIWLFVRNEK